MAEPLLLRAEERLWYSPPGHHRAYSKLLVGPESGSSYLDFRVSLYPPQGYVEEHAHRSAENIYYILRGHALVELDGRRHVVGPNTVVFIPPGVRHALYNTGDQDLLFIVVAAPASDMPR